MMGRRIHLAVAMLTVASLVVAPVFGQTAGPQTQEQTQGQSSSHQAAQAGTPATDQPRNLKVTEEPDYSLGQFWFRYVPRHVQEPVLTNAPRMDQLIQGGKLMLSIDDAVSIALENNLDIAVQRFTPWFDETSLLLAQSGANGRLSFDPVLTGTLNLSQTSSPINNPFLSGTGQTITSAVPVIDHNFVANVNYSQNFPTGTQFQVGFTNERTSTNLGTYLFNPYVQSTLTATLTQPLLNGFGRLPNTRYILEAKNTVKVGEWQFAQQVITTVTQVATDYWELVYARESVKVAQASIGVDQKLYDDNKKQLEIGTMAPLDVLTAESQLATDQQVLVQAQTTQLQDETNLLVAITKNPLAGKMTGIEIVPTTPISTPDVVENIPLQDAVQEAWQKRPELQQAELNLKNVGIEIKATRNALLPSLNLFGEYEAIGLGGFNKSPAISGGFGSDLSTLIHAQYPTLEAGINLTFPLRNRAAEANNTQAQLSERQQTVQYQQTKSTIVLSVRNAMIALTQDRAAVVAAEKARSLAQQVLDDEQKKYQLGTSTSYNVVLRARDLTAAEGTELRDRINLTEAELTFNQAMGRTLDTNHIVVADALRGKTLHDPLIPGTPNWDSGVPGK